MTQPASSTSSESCPKTTRVFSLGRVLILAPSPIVLFVIAILVVALANSFWLDVFTSAMIAAIAIAGVGLLYGRLSLIALNQYALVGVGAWVSMRLDHALGWHFELSLLAGGAAAAAIGVIWGLPALRLRGVYLALVTLMMAGAFQVFIGAVGFPEGGSGFFGRVTDGSSRMVMHRPALTLDDRGYFLYVCGVLLVVLVALEFLQRARPARAWALMRRDERMAAMSGVHILLAKLLAFALAGFLAGLSGALLAGLSGHLEGPSFSAVSSIMLFAICVIAGAGYPLGAIAGGLLLKVPPLAFVAAGLNGYLAQVLMGALLMHALTTGPQGLAGDLLRLVSTVRKHWLTRRDGQR